MTQGTERIDQIDEKEPSVKPQITTVKATPDNVSDSELLMLIKKFCADTFDPAGKLGEDTRSKLLKALASTDDTNLIENGISTDENLQEDERQRLEEFSNDIKGNYAKIKRLMKEGHLVISRVNDQIVGAMAAKKHGKMPDGSGRDIYEITQAIVLPEFRGQHISQHLALSLIGIIRGNPESKNSPLMSVSKTPEVNAMCQKYRFKEEPMDFLYKISDKEPGSDAWIEDKKLKPEWKVYIMDPLAS